LIAAKDRGKLDLLETASRVPLVAVYTIFGSAALEHYFKKFLYKYKKKDFSSLITQNPTTKALEVPKLEELKGIAQKIYEQNKDKTTYEQEWKKLLKGKAVITAGPYLFSLVAMGFILSALNRYWTARRYKNGVGRENKSQPITNNINKQTFKNFV